ncbi:hypothetical protein [Tateyamaria sp. ANG-S1]|uniref:hypothetical protein n=1 Tax=Tateyamaria sp. ANG-S1 TaxID=1577905 RepID=UPI00057F3F7F|nr:hypothetical protein [Tateyamaria sp. ANG-S1]KIC49677.1 hypothetical protein RA29_08405 [Tateyamaria sp. ANG-S1]
MIRSLLAAGTLAVASLAMPAIAQDAAQTPPPGPAANTPPPAEGGLFGGTLTPAATAAIVGIGIAVIAIASDSSDGTTTTTTTR